MRRCSVSTTRGRMARRCNSQSRPMLPSVQGAPCGASSCPDRDLGRPLGVGRPDRGPPAGCAAPAPGAPVGGRRTRRLPFLTCRRPLRRRPRRPSPRPSTPPTTSWSSRASRRSASGPACTSAPPTPAGSCTASGRSSTTRVDEALGGHCDRVEVILHARRLGRGARRRPRHPGRHRAQDRAARRRGGLHQAARGRQVRRRLVRRHRRPARRRRLGGQRAVLPARRRGRPRRQDPRDVASGAACPGVFDRRRARTRAFTAEQSGLRKVRHGSKKGVTGTRVRFWPDRQIFTEDADVRPRRAGRPGPADRRSSCPGSTLVDPRPARRRAASRRVFRHDGGIAEFCEFLAPDEPVTDVLRLQGTGTFTETVPVLDDKGHMTPHGGRARARRRRRGALGHRLRHRGALVRQHHRHPQGRHPRRRLRAGPDQDASTSSSSVNARRLKVGERRASIKDDVLDGPDRGGHRAAGRAAVRGPDQGGARHQRRARHRRPRSSSKELTSVLTSTKRGEKAAGRAAAREGRLRRSKTRIARGSTRRPSAARTPWSPRRCRPSSPTAAAPTSSAPSCSSSRATARSAPPSWPATPSSRRCCRSAARSSTCRRPRSPTCSRTPSAPRSSRSSAPARAAPSTSTRPATARSSSWPTPTSTAPTSAPCCSPCSSATCARCVEAGRVYAAVPPLHRIEVINAGSKAERGTSTPTPTPRCAARWPTLTKRGKTTARTRCSATRAWARWTPTSCAETTMDPRHRTLRRVTAADADVAPQGSSSCSWAATSAPRKDFIIDSAARPRPRAHRRLSRIRLSPKGSRAARPGQSGREGVGRRPCRAPGRAP